jgi:hypothetical protein
MSRRSSLKSSTKGTQKKVNFRPSPPHRKETGDKEYEGEIAVAELDNLWSLHNKNMNTVIVDQLEDDFLEKHPFEIKNKSEFNKLEPKEQEDYKKKIEEHKSKMKTYIKDNYAKKKQEMKSHSVSKEAARAAHYYRLNKIDKVPVTHKKLNTTIKSIPKLNVKVSPRSPNDVIQVRRAVPVPRSLERTSLENERQRLARRNQSSGLFSRLTERVRKLFGSNKTIGGRKSHRTQKRH